MAATVGELIKEARTKAGLSQTKLAEGIGGLTAADISAAERGTKELSQAQLKAIAKATGVTQASLLNAAKSAPAAKKPAAAKPAAAKTAAAKKPAAKTTAKTAAAKKPAAKKPAAKPAAKTTAAKKPATPANANSTMKVTATERKLVEAYRAADSTAKKNALAVLKGTETAGSMAESIISDLMGGIFGGKK